MCQERNSQNVYIYDKDRYVKVDEYEEVDFTIVKEEWNEYKLSDGSTLKIRLILSGIIRSKNNFDPIGNPMYLTTSANIVRVFNVPKELKSKPQIPNIEPR
jgi:hypothetical protein